MKRFILLIVALIGIGAPFGAANAQGYATIFGQPSGSTPIPIYVDSAGRIYVVVDPAGLAAATTLYTSAALEGSKVVSAAPIILVGVAVTTSSTAGYLMVWNLTTVPADGAVTPALCFYIPSFPSTVAYAINFKGSVGTSMAFSTGAGCYTKVVSATVTFMAWTTPLL